MFGHGNFTLKNGMEVYTNVEKNSNDVSILFLMPEGWYVETPENAGIMHLYEHMTLKGNSIYGSSEEAWKELKANGGDFNAFTSSGMMTFYLTVNKNELERALAFYNAALRAPLFTQEEFEKEKKIVITEMSGRMSAYDEAHFLIGSYLVQECPTFMVNYAGKESLENATLEDLYFIKNQLFNPSNISLCISGNINEKETKKLVEDIFGSWEDSPYKTEFTGTRNVQKVEVPSIPLIVVNDANEIDIGEFIIDEYFRLPGPSDFDAYKKMFYLILLIEDNDEKVATFIPSEYEDEFYNASPYYLNKNATIIRSSLYGNIFETKYLEWMEKFPSILYENISNHDELFTKEHIKKQKKEALAVYSEANYSSSISKCSAIASLIGMLGKENYYSFFNDDWNISKEEMLEFVDEYFCQQKPLKIIRVDAKTKSTYRRGVALWKNPVADEKFINDLMEESFARVQGRGILSHGKVEYKPDEKVKKFEGERNVVVESDVQYEEKTLHQNVPLIVVKNKDLKDFSINSSFGFQGNLLRQECKKLPNVLLNNLCNNGTKYSKKQRRDLYEEKNMWASSSLLDNELVVLGGSNKEDYQEFMDYYLDSVFKTSFNAGDIREWINNYKNPNYQNSPEDYAYEEMKNVIDAEKGFAIGYDRSYETIKDIDINTVNEFHDTVLMDFSNMFFVVAGNLSNKEIRCIEKMLNERIDEMAVVREENGYTDGSKYFYSDEEIEARKKEAQKVEREKTVVVRNKDCGEVSFIYRLHDVIKTTDFKDFMAYSLANKIYSNTLVEVFRMKYNCCYSAWSSYELSDRAGGNFGYSCIYYANDYSDCEKLFAEVEENIRNEVNIEELLPELKNGIFSSFLNKGKNAAEMASYSRAYVVKYGAPDFPAKNIHLLDEITAEDVMSVLEEYFFIENPRYYISTGINK